MLALLATYYLLLVLPLLPSPAILAIEAILTTTTFVTGATLTKTTFVTGAILYTWATLSTSPTDISLSTGVTLIIAVTLVTGAILFTWATLSTTPTDISLSTGAIGVTLATEALLSPRLLTLFSLLGVLSLIAILVLHLLLVLIGQLKLLVLFLLLALVLNKSRYVLRKICKRSHNYRQTVLEFKYVKRATFYCQTSHH